MTDHERATQIVVEDHGAYQVVADIEPTHGTIRWESTPWMRAARAALSDEKLTELESLLPEGSVVSVGIYRGKKGRYQAIGFGIRTDYPHSSIESAVRTLVGMAKEEAA